MVKKRRKSKLKEPWATELNEIVRGVSGGFLFGIPIIYTMEVWAIGSQVRPSLMLILLGLTYFILFLFNSVEGFRRSKGQTVTDFALESIEALAIGLVCVTVILILLQRITLQTSLSEALGKIIFESVPFALGVSLARLLLSTEDSEGKPKSKSNKNTENFRSQKHNFLKNDTIADASATFLGATIIAFSIAPTEEVMLLAVTASPPWLIGIIFASLLISYSIVFGAGFAKEKKRRSQRGIFQSAESETVFSYLISLVASVLMLCFFQQLSFSDPWFLWLRTTILLGLPATIGGAAGRLGV